MRAASDSSVSPSSTGTAAWMTMGPLSVASSTKCTVHPDTRTPARSACRTPCIPEKAGRSEGWMFSTRWGKADSSTGVTMRMNPARHTSSTPRERSSDTRRAS